MVCMVWRTENYTNHILIIGKSDFNILMIFDFTSAGEKLQLQAIVDGIPFPAVEWYRENVLLKESDRIHLEMDKRSGVCSLVIKLARREDMGEYECMAKNRAGEASTYCEVIVDQLSDSDGRGKRNDRAKNGRLSLDLARGMSTDMMDSDDNDNDQGKCFISARMPQTDHVFTQV